MPGNGIQLASERRQIFQLLQEEHDVPCEHKERQVAAYVENRYNETAVRVNALRALVSSLAGLPGRKAVLYVRLPQARVEGAKGQLYIYEMKLQLGKGAHTVAVGIEDAAAASTSMLRGRVEVKG